MRKIHERLVHMLNLSDQSDGTLQQLGPQEVMANDLGSQDTIRIKATQRKKLK